MDNSLRTTVNAHFAIPRWQTLRSAIIRFGKDVLKANHTHPHLSFRPSHVARAARLLSNRQQVDARPGLGQPALLSPRVLRPSRSLQAVGQRSELVDVHRQRDVHILCPAIIVNPNAVGGGANNDGIHTSVLTRSLQLSQGFDLLWQKLDHGRRNFSRSSVAASTARGPPSCNNSA